MSSIYCVLRNEHKNVFKLTSVHRLWMSFNITFMLKQHCIKINRQHLQSFFCRALPIIILILGKYVQMHTSNIKVLKINQNRMSFYVAFKVYRIIFPKLRIELIFQALNLNIQVHRAYDLHTLHRNCLEKLLLLLCYIQMPVHKNGSEIDLFFSFG